MCQNLLFKKIIDNNFTKKIKLRSYWIRVGFVINFVDCMFGFMKSKVDPFMVDILAGSEALYWLGSCHMDDIILATDSQRLWQAFTSITLEVLWFWDIIIGFWSYYFRFSSNRFVGMLIKQFIYRQRWFYWKWINLSWLCW